MTILMDERLQLPKRPSQTIRPAVVLQFPGLDVASLGGPHHMPQRKADEQGAKPTRHAIWHALRHVWQRRSERRALSRQLSRLPNHLLADIGVDTAGNHHDF